MISIKIGKQIRPKYKLENDPMCGVPTGGMEECFWDCEVDGPNEISPNGPIITAPECLLDCFPEVNKSKLNTKHGHENTMCQL